MHHISPSIFSGLTVASGPRLTHIQPCSPPRGPCKVSLTPQYMEVSQDIELEGGGANPDSVHGCICTMHSSALHQHAGQLVCVGTWPDQVWRGDSLTVPASLWVGGERLHSPAFKRRRASRSTVHSRVRGVPRGGTYLFSMSVNELWISSEQEDGSGPAETISNSQRLTTHGTEPEHHGR